MKSKGQTLVMFVIMLPLMLMIMALLVDVGLMYKENIKLKSVSKQAIKEILENDDINGVRDLFKNNGIDTDNLVISLNDKVEISNEYEIDSIFGKILGFNNYRIKIDLIGYYENNQLIIEG